MLKRQSLVVAGVVCCAMLAGAPLEQAASVGTLQGQIKAPGREDLSGFVVWIDDIEGDFRPPEKHEVIDQKNLRFAPRVLPILAGAVVDFPNSDPLLHNVFSISKPKRFNLGLYPKGEVPSIRFDQPGVVEILCHVHPEMAAYIIVLKNPYFAVTGPNGRFTISNVPAGEHVLRVWSEKGSSHEQKVVVKPGAVHTVRFSVRQ